MLAAPMTTDGSDHLLETTRCRAPADQAEAASMGGGASRKPSATYPSRSPIAGYPALTLLRAVRADRHFLLGFARLQGRLGTLSP
jgi:hypothetical protein